MNKFTVTIVTIQDVINSDLYKIILKALEKQKIDCEVSVKNEY